MSLKDQFKTVKELDAALVDLKKYRSELIENEVAKATERFRVGQGVVFEVEDDTYDGLITKINKKSISVKSDAFAKNKTVAPSYIVKVTSEPEANIDDVIS